MRADYLEYKVFSGEWSDLGSGSRLYDSLKNLYGLPCCLSQLEIPSLRGIEACRVAGCKFVINEILTHGSIEIRDKYPVR